MKLEVLSERRPESVSARVLVRLHATAQPLEARRPVNLALLVDRSSSMRGPRLKQAVLAAAELIDRLDEKDRLSILSFDAHPQVLCESAPVTEERRAELKSALENLRSGVGTNLGAALKVGADSIRSTFVRKAIARVILLTDGQASVGVTDRDKLAALSGALKEAGVTITCMGLGHSFDDELLMEIAEQGSGSYYYLDQPSDIPAAFGRELEGVFAISARETQLKFVPNEDVESLELSHKLPCTPLDDGLLVDVGDVSATAPRSLLFRLRLQEGKEPSSLGTIAVTYRDAEGNAADPHLMGIPAGHCTGGEQTRTLVAEDLKLRVAHAVDQAWARRTSGNAAEALLGLREVHQAVQKELEAQRCEPGVATLLLEDLASAEIAVADGAAELERVRRGLREKSQLTKFGHSVLYNLRSDE